MVKAREVRRLPRQIDALRCCQQQQVLEGQLPLKALPRLAEVLSLGGEGNQVIQPLLQFGMDDEGHAVMHGHFVTTVPVLCQRCLEIMDYPVTADFHCAFVASDEKAKGLPSHLEPVVLATDSTQVELYDLLEDELLLNLPISAFHERCDGDGSPKKFGEAELQPARASEKPFAALAELLKKG